VLQVVPGAIGLGWRINRRTGRLVASWPAPLLIGLMLPAIGNPTRIAAVLPWVRGVDLVATHRPGSGRVRQSWVAV
jgi:hypothetical protein